MATKKATTSEKARALMNRAYDLRTIKKINATPAEKAKQARQSIDASKTAARAKAIADRADAKKPAAKMSRQFGTTGKTLKDIKQMNLDKMAKAKKK